MNYKITAFGASNSTQSINKKLANYAAHRISQATVNLIDLNDYAMPLFSIDIENNTGIPQLAHDFKEEIKNSDGLIISFAEHNGAYSVAFKNVYDWISRIGSDVWLETPMFLIATSPGARGGKSVLDIAVDKLGRQNKNMVASFSLPSFERNFSEEEGIMGTDLLNEFNVQLKLFIDCLHNHDEYSVN